MARRTALLAVLTIVALAAVWGAFRVLPRWLRGGAETASSPAATAATPATPAAAERKIKATLYYVAEDGLSMAAAEREIPFAEPVAAQARSIIEAQLAEAPAPLGSAIPAGTTLRSVFVTERGDAFVDLSADATAKHPGGVLEELFTVYAVVNALTVNLPAIVRVQILVNGHEADTLAGHLDL
ncbi:MAG: GerMN domain-containing protein, partial [Acidobacteriota bacterium]